MSSAAPAPTIARAVPGELLDTAYSDLRVGSPARGLLGLYVRLGKVLSAEEVWSSHLAPEGRDAVRRMVKELKDLGYIVIVRGYDHENRVFYSRYEFAPETPQVPSDRACVLATRIAGNPGDNLYLVTSSTAKTRKGPKGPISRRSASEVPEISSEVNDTPIGSGWQAALDALGSRYRKATAPQGQPRTMIRRKTRTDLDLRKDPDMPRDPERSLGDDIDVVDPLAAATQPRSKTPKIPASERRFVKNRDSWTSFDLTAEFNSRAYESGAGDVPHQINSRNLGGALGRLIGQGSKPEALAECIDLFFDKPSNLKDLGQGSPLWRRFLGDITHTYGKAQRILAGKVMTSDDYYAESVLLSQEQAQALAAIRARQEREDAERASAAQDDAVAADQAREQREALAAERRAAQAAWRAEQERLAAASAEADRLERDRIASENEARYAEHPDEELLADEEDLLIDGEVEA